MIKLREIKNDAEYNPFLIAGNAPFNQAWFFGKWQEIMGRKVRRFEILNNSEVFGFFQVIKYPMPFSQNILYIPHGPVLKEMGLDNEFLKTFRDKLIDLAKEENAVFARFDLFSSADEKINKFFKKVPSYGYQSSYFQPKFEWIVNLGKTEDELLGEMHPKTRYNIRLSEKKGVKIIIVGGGFEKYFDDFYKLLEETAKRDNFILHTKDYYRNIFQTIDSNNAFLMIAEYEGKTLLINVVLLYGKTAYFVFGGSSGEYKNLMFSHLAQWEAIKESKRRGMAVYNFGGVQGNSGSYENYEGVSVFKKRFGGELLEYSDSYDLILKPFWYKLYNLRKWVLNLK